MRSSYAHAGQQSGQTSVAAGPPPNLVCNTQRRHLVNHKIYFPLEFPLSLHPSINRMYASKTERSVYSRGQEEGGDAPTNFQATALIQGEGEVRCNNCPGCYSVVTCKKSEQNFKTPCPMCIEHTSIYCFHLQLCEGWSKEYSIKYRYIQAYKLEYFKGKCDHPVYLTYLQNKQDQIPPSFSLPLPPLINTGNIIQTTMGTTKGATAIVHSTREQNIFNITTTPQPHPPTTHPSNTTPHYISPTSAETRTTHSVTSPPFSKPLPKHSTTPNTQHDTQRSDIGELVDVFKSMLSQTNNSATKNNFFKAPSMSLSKVEDSGDHIDAIS